MPDIRAVLIDFAGRRRAKSFDVWPPELLGHTKLLRGTDIDRSADLEAYVASLADSVDPAEPSFVITYCTAAGIGQELARVLRRKARREVTLIAFDPAVLTPTDFVDAYHEIVEEVGADSTAPLLEIADQDVVRDPARVRAMVFQDITARFADLIGCPGAKLGEDPTLDEFAERYFRWLSFVLLAGQVAWEHPSGPVIQVCSNDHREIPVWHGVASEHRLVRLAVSHDDMLASPNAVELVEDLMQVGRAGPKHH